MASLEAARGLTLALSLALPALAAPSKGVPAPGRPAAALRAERVRALLVAQRALQGKALIWESARYALRSPASMVCESYSGACFEAEDEGSGAPVVLAFYEIEPGQLGFSRVSAAEFRKGRTQDAIHYYLRHGTRLNDVFKLRDNGGRALFDAKGRLTAEGEAAYEAALEGKAAAGGGGAAVPAPKRPWGDPAKARLKLQALRQAGYFEVTQAEYACLHDKLHFPDDQMSTTYIYEGYKLHILIHDDASAMLSSLVEIYHKSGRCSPGGTTIRPR